VVHSPQVPSLHHAPSALRIRGLRKQYGDVIAVDSLDLDVREGECFGLLGPNGAGKTTTVEICEGLLEPDSGTLEILGRAWRNHRRELQQMLGVQLQETQFSDKLTVAETLSLFRSFYHHNLETAEAIRMVQLEAKRDSRVGTLSGGQKQRLALACALIGDPQFLFLDEPTTGLDPQSRRQLWDLVEDLKGAGRTILLTTHYMDEAERLCDRVGVMDHGRIIALDTPRALIASLGAEHLVEFAIGDDAAAPDAPLWQRIEGVRRAHVNGGTVQLEVAELHRTVPALLEELKRLNLPMTGLRTHSATLEDVFVSLTGRHLRDE
jgi:ABC-2 type transport system ATP-binding protein